VFGGGIAPLLSGVLVALFAGWIGVVIYMPETRGRDLKLTADA
jgi:hypothetical protein